MTRLAQTRVDASGLVSRGRFRRRFGGYSAPARLYRRLRPRWAWERANPLGRATRRYVREHGLTVAAGPFSGLVYPKEAVGTVAYLPPKLLGSYERELARYFADARDFDLFVDIGAGDGYYCVGYKRLFPNTRVIGFETDRTHRRMATNLARLNGVEVEMMGVADHDALNALPDGRLLILVDVEGYEHQLVDPTLVPRLRRAMMIVETHSMVHPDIVQCLTARFKASHEISIVTGSARLTMDYGMLAGWEEAQARYALTEGRGVDPLWLVLDPLVDLT